MSAFNKQFQDIKKDMDPAVVEEYRKKGEEMYSNMDMFTNRRVVNEATGEEREVAQHEIDAAHELILFMKSGQHISTFSDSEKTIMENIFGKKWFKRFGYEKRDLTELHTFPAFGTEFKGGFS